MLRRTILLSLVGVALAALPSLAAGPAPAQLFHRLLTTKFAPSELPSGFRLPYLTRAKPSSTATGHHVLGEVSVSTNGPDADDLIFYEVFPTTADAHADLPTSVPAPDRVLGPVPGYRQSALIVGSRPGYGVTAVVVQEQNVVVTVTNDWVKNLQHGNLPAALALLRAATKHLVRVDKAAG
jgi:hypothetical protein